MSTDDFGCEQINQRAVRARMRVREGGYNGSSVTMKRVGCTNGKGGYRLGLCPRFSCHFERLFLGLLEHA